VFHHNSNQTSTSTSASASGPNIDRNNTSKMMRKVTGSIKQIIDKMFEDFYDQNILISTLEDQDLAGVFCFVLFYFFCFVFSYNLSSSLTSVLTGEVGLELISCNLILL
jgi:hypothetical protein